MPIPPEDFPEIECSRDNLGGVLIMPLETGSSRQVISHNVAVEVRAGKPSSQEAAIAYRKAGETDDDLPSEKPLDRSLRFYAPVKLSENISETKEGFLICRDVCIARTGEMLYKGDEIENVRPGFDGIVRITRDGATIDKMSCDRVDAVFVGASELLKAENMRKVSTSTQTKDGASVNVHARGGLDAFLIAQQTLNADTALPPVNGVFFGGTVVA
jgi:hypothetical protein